MNLGGPSLIPCMSWAWTHAGRLFVRVRIRSQRFFTRIYTHLIPMYPFATYVLRSYYKATGWNEDNLYANLTRASHGQATSHFGPGGLLKQNPGSQLCLISPFHGVSISPSPNHRMPYSERPTLWMPCRRCMALSATSSRRVSSTSRTRTMCS